MIQDFINIKLLFVYTFNFSYQSLAMIEYCPIFIPLPRNSHPCKDKKCCSLNTSYSISKSILSLLHLS